MLCMDNVCMYKITFLISLNLVGWLVGI